MDSIWGIATISYKLREICALGWFRHVQHDKDAVEEKYFYTNWWPINKKRWMEKDIDKNNKNRYEEVQI